MPPERSAQNVCTHTHWMQSGGCSTHAHTHTCSWRASLLPHHSMKKGCGDRHGESVWWWCGPLAGMQGVVAMVSCTAAQHGLEKRENEGGRGSQRVSRCDLCWHCMSMLMKKKGGGGRGRYAPCLFMLLYFGCLPATALCRAGVPRTHTHTHPLLLLLNIIVQHHAHGACACMFVSVLSVQHTHDVRRKEGRESGLFGLLLLCLCDWFLPLIHSPTPS